MAVPVPSQAWGEAVVRRAEWGGKGAVTALSLLPVLWGWKSPRRAEQGGSQKDPNDVFDARSCVHVQFCCQAQGE